MIIFFLQVISVKMQFSLPKSEDRLCDKEKPRAEMLTCSFHLAARRLRPPVPHTTSLNTIKFHCPLERRREQLFLKAQHLYDVLTWIFKASKGRRFQPGEQCSAINVEKQPDRAIGLKVIKKLLSSSTSPSTIHFIKSFPRDPCLTCLKNLPWWRGLLRLDDEIRFFPRWFWFSQSIFFS